MFNFKTRDISIYELFEILQKEYIVCILRKKIYPFHKHKKYWGFVAEKKKEKILNIAERNNLPNIFSSSDIMNSLSNYIYGKGGFPNFIYRDDEHKLKQERWDFINYFKINSEVKINIEGVILIGKIIRFNYETKKISVGVKDNTYRLSCSEVTRIL